MSTNAIAKTLTTYFGNEFGYDAKEPTQLYFLKDTPSFFGHGGRVTILEGMKTIAPSCNPKVAHYIAVGLKIAGCLPVLNVFVGLLNCFSGGFAIGQGDFAIGARLISRGLLEVYNFSAVLIIADVAVTALKLKEVNSVFERFAR